MASLTTCSTCGASIATSATTCPKCGKKITSRVTRGLAVGCGFILAVSFLSAIIGGSNNQHTGRPTTADIMAAKLGSIYVDLDEKEDQSLMEPMKNLARWELALNTDCETADYIGFDPDDKSRVYITCRAPRGVENVTYSVEDMRALDAAIRAGHVPLLDEVKPLQVVGGHRRGP